MSVVHDIFYAMSDGNKCRFCWGIHITTQSHGELLKIIACLDSDVHESTNPVIELTPMWVFNFAFSSNERCIREELLFKRCIYWKRQLLKLQVIFCIFSQIFFNGIFDDMICLINTDEMFTLDYVNIEVL